MTKTQLKKTLNSFRDNLKGYIRVKYRIDKKRTEIDSILEFTTFPPVLLIYSPDNPHYNELVSIIAHELGHIINFAKKPYNKSDTIADYYAESKNKVTKSVKEREILAWIEGWKIFSKKAQKNIKDYYKIIMAESLRTYNIKLENIIKELKKIK